MRVSCGTALVMVDNDVKSCYDRVLRSLAMIACISYGLPICTAKMHNHVHGKMEHKIKTAQVRSKESYSGSVSATSSEAAAKDQRHPLQFG